MHIGDMGMTADQVLSTVSSIGEPVAGIEGTDENGERMTWTEATGWQVGQDTDRSLVAGDFQDRRVLCQDSEMAGFLGYGRVFAMVGTGTSDDDRIVCVFPTLQGAEIESELALDAVTLLSDRIEMTVETPGQNDVVLDVTDDVLRMEDEDILKIMDGPVDSLPGPLRQAALVDESTNSQDQARARIVDSVCDYFGVTPVAAGPDGTRRVSESAFTDALENTRQCRLLRDMELAHTRTADLMQ
ncbi:hypothetical protein Salmuc_01848 [Salipiger mucosus DSM 16094]|uniref:Uncharacterized protein n=2 Tax=Salipiger mucosus TaxID=263378 RepID=S9QWU4_9RHOB|nr:hypothetical protein Salmuc_01848 [Salipiger mucosus DSM 16094]